MTIAVATSFDFPAHERDDGLLIRALKKRGHDAVPVAWGDAATDWSTIRTCIVRSTWDYHLNRSAFLKWARRVSSEAELWNPLPIIEWNTHKSYLRDLERCGVPTVSTHWIAPGANGELVAIMSHHDWSDVVVKPAVGASAHESARFTRAEADRGQAHIDRLLTAGDVLVQPLLKSVFTRGETSLIYIADRFSHALVKTPADGDYRSQYELGGTVRAVEPTPTQLDVALRALRAVESPLLFARVDMIDDEGGRPRVIEMELVEPELYFTIRPDAADVLADALIERL